MKSKRIMTYVAASTIVTLIFAGSVFAHCDTTRGPVIPEAKAALERGDVTPVLKWVKQDYEPEIRSAFAKTLAVRSKTPEAKELADHYFLETLVRLHRAGEGAPYSGISDAPVEPIVALSEKAIAGGSPDAMIRAINAHMTEAIREKFHNVIKTAKDKDRSVEAGREYVEAYVTYMHYVEGIHGAIASAADHHAGGAEAAGVHKH
jgi:hypothetical protein